MLLNMDLLRFVDEMKQVSENVKDYLENEIYLDRFGAYSDATSSDILMECVKIIIDELVSYGVIFTCESDFLEDFFNARKIILLKKFVLIDTWLKVFNDNEVLLDEIETLVFNDIGESDTELLELVIAKVQESSPVFEFEPIFGIENDVYSDARFRKYMKTVLDYIRERGPAMDVNVSGQYEYIEQVRRNREWIKRFADEFYVRERKNTRINRAYLDYLVVSYDMDKLNADNIRLYQLVDRDDVPDSLIPLKNTLMDRHHKTIPHHIEYWCEGGSSDREPWLEDIVLLVIHNYEHGMSFEEFLVKNNRMVSEYPHIFSRYDRIIKVCVEAVKYILES